MINMPSLLQIIALCAALCVSVDAFQPSISAATPLARHHQQLTSTPTRLRNGVSSLRLAVSPAAKQFVDERIRNFPIMVFGQSFCPFTRGVLNRFHLHFGKTVKPKGFGSEFIDQLDESLKDSIQDYLEELTGARTTPRVFFEGKFLGGGEEVADMGKQGKLTTMLLKAGYLDLPVAK